MRGSLLPKLPNVQVQKRLRPVTLRDFSGGWNTLDSDLSMQHKYSKVLTNCFPQGDGTIAVRQGIQLFSDMRSFLAAGETLINARYFIDCMVVVTSQGNVYKVTGDGSVTALDTTIWGPTSFCSFAVFNKQLIICNGSDKPLAVGDDFIVELLQDAGTNTNINVPICKYVLAINRYLLMAGDPLFPDRIHISAKDAPGTWFGDPPPNDATRIDIGSTLSSANTIRGLMSFRGKVIAMFAEGLVFGTLGTYDDAGNHTPSFDDGVEGFGSVSHRSGVAYGDDGFFVDLEGVSSIKRTVLSASFKPDRASDLIDPDVKSALKGLDFNILEDNIFSIYNESEAQFLLFIPSADLTTQQVFVHTYRPGNAQNAWSLFTGWNFVAAARSLEGNTFFFSGDGRIWLYGSVDRPFAKDYMAPGNPGIGISFEWEMPWMDFGDRSHSKVSRYIAFDTEGESEFVCEMFVDRLMTQPSNTTRFSGGDQGGFGHGPQPFGGGRNTSVEKLYAWNSKFQLAKLRFTGIADAGLKFVSVTMHMLLGSISR